MQMQGKKKKKGESTPRLIKAGYHILHANEDNLRSLSNKNGWQFWA